ncbi:MAG: O-antigen ligase family protein [Nitrosomonas sp.]|nr:O-antigen ligase family protein [Nitrosomonas sp.]
MNEKQISITHLLSEHMIGVEWRERFIRFSLIFFCFALWQKWSFFYAFFLLSGAWILDGGLRNLKQLIREPLTQGILVFCSIVAIGLLWGDYIETNQNKWKKYFILLTFIPFFALLSKDKMRVSWVSNTFLIIYCSVVLTGAYQYFVQGLIGVPVLDISYLSFSAILGIGVVTTIFLAQVSQTTLQNMMWWFVSALLLLLQFNQGARTVLFATLIAAIILIFFMNQSKRKVRLIGISSFVGLTLLLMATNPVMQERLSLVSHDWAAIKLGNYETSLGYRLAIWDIGLNGIQKQPWIGHGTGNPEVYFEKEAQTYKDGIYRNLPAFQKTSHYHNDWIEIGMHLGGLGIMALAFLMFSWFKLFKENQLSNLGIAFVSYIVLAGMTDTFLLYNRVPPILLVMTALLICWQRSKMDN